MTTPICEIEESCPAADAAKIRMFIRKSRMRPMDACDCDPACNPMGTCAIGKDQVLGYTIQQYMELIPGLHEWVITGFVDIHSNDKIPYHSDCRVPDRSKLCFVEGWEKVTKPEILALLERGYYVCPTNDTPAIPNSLCYKGEWTRQYEEVKENCYRYVPIGFKAIDANGKIYIEDCNPV